MASDPITSWEIDGETVETVSDFIFWGSKITADGDCIESEKVGLKLNIQKMKIMGSGPITLWQINGETMETVTDIIFGELQTHCRW